MASLVRLSVVAVSFAVVLFSTSCEEHPLGQMPEVQREQSDPATRTWSEESETEKPVASPTPVEAVPHEAR
jgi:hypothetical protein